ncbi:MAG: DUF2905 family protein [Burkholderiaceae bacterium]
MAHATPPLPVCLARQTVGTGPALAFGPGGLVVVPTLVAARRPTAVKWLIAVVIGLFLFNGLQRQLGKLGFGRLPGDFTSRCAGASIRSR